MIVLQNIIHPELSVNTPDIQMYLRGSDRLRAMNTNLVIPKYDTISFDTYINYFSVKKWKDLCQVPNLLLNIHIIGHAILEVVGVKEVGYDFLEEVLVSKVTHDNTIAEIDIHSFEKYDTLYLRIHTLDQSVELISANFATQDNIRHTVKLAICIPTSTHFYSLIDNIKNLVDELRSQWYQDILSDIKFIVVNQGEDFDFTTVGLEMIQVKRQRNLGQAGAIVMASKLAITQDCSHILILDDDLALKAESVLRTLRFFQMVIDIRQDICIAGAIFSQTDKWEVLKINTVSEDQQYLLPEAKLDARDVKTAFELAKCDSKRGTANWSYTAFSTKIFDAYDFPMPLFNQGSDREFMARIYKETISLNGICGWQQSRTFRYNTINEDYYFVRNTMINALLDPKPQFAMIDKFVWQRFWHNIKTYNYIGARLNLYAINHILRKKYEADSEDINQWVNKLYQLEKSRIRYTYTGKRSNIAVNDTKTRIIQVTAYLNPLKKMKGVSKIGENRDEQDFMGKNEVYVLDPLTGTAEIALLKRKKIAQLTSQMIKTYALFRKDYQKIKKELLFFRNKSTTSAYWQEILNKK